MIAYTTSTAGVTPGDLEGFFEGWRAPPPPARRVAILQGSQVVVIARDGARVIGFVTALSDGVQSAFIPLLEVLPAYRARGIGTELVRRALAALGPLYAVDVVCDEDLVGFYERFGMVRTTGMSLRRYS